MATPRRAACAEVTALERSDKVARVRKCSNLRTLLCDAFTRPVPRAARKLQMSRTRDVAQDSTGYRGYHRVSSGLGGRTPELPFLARILPFLARRLPFLARFCHFANIFCLFWRFAQKNFGFHRVSRISEGFRGFHRVSSAESASRHSSAGYVFEALPRWRAESVGWNNYLGVDLRERAP